MKKFYLFITILITISILLFVAKPILLHYYTYDQDFNSSIWLSDGSNVGQYTHRQMMTNHLVNDILPEKSEKYISIFLGRSVPRERFPRSKAHFIYLLGKERKIISFKSEWLFIYLDNNKTFERSEILMD